MTITREDICMMQILVSTAISQSHADIQASDRREDTRSGYATFINRYRGIHPILYARIRRTDTYDDLIGKYPESLQRSATYLL
jgi:hypothetical protein